jgi:EAL domain-containing protein (putative c-di-GMP-specific phosphodiesterase class I)
VLALALGVLVVWRRLSSDPDLRADAHLFVNVSVRLLRRPAVVAGALATLAALAVLVFAIDHAIAG